MDKGRNNILLNGNKFEIFNENNSFYISVINVYETLCRVFVIITILKLDNFQMIDKIKFSLVLYMLCIERNRLA